MAYVLAEDAPPSSEEAARAVELLNSGEITLDDFEWLMGKPEPLPVDVKKMSPRERRRFFAIQGAQMKRAGAGPTRRRRRAKGSATMFGGG